MNMDIFIRNTSQLKFHVLGALGKGEYSIEQVKEIHVAINEKQEKYKKSIKSLAIVACVSWLFINILFTINWGFSFSGIAIATIPMIFGFFYVKWSYTSLVRRQFIRAVQQGYPSFDFSKLH